MKGLRQHNRRRGRRSGWSLAPNLFNYFLVEPKLPASDQRRFAARAVVATAITCLQAATEEWLQLRGATPLFDLYDAAVQAVHPST
ncbi:MAG: hypothetical protein ABI903_00570 [Actinomycetota bacterium]